MLKKLTLFSFVFSFLLITCLFSESNNDRILEYNVKDKDFIIVVLFDGLSYHQAKDYGLERASEITVRKGYRHFVITSESQVLVMRGKRDWPSPYDFPQNLYEEEIIERGFSRERFYYQERGDTEPKPALQLKVECVPRRTSKSYDACDYTQCR